MAMIRWTAGLVIASCCLTVSVADAASCYTPQQYRAEQAVRYHTQLMVSGMLCQRTHPTAYSQYQAFTQRNQPTIQRAETVLIGFYKEQKNPQPERALHTMRTNLANDLSMRAMQQSLPVFCQNAQQRLQTAAAMPNRQFEGYLTKLDLRQNSLHPVCSDTSVQTIKATTTITKSVIPAQELVAPSHVQK